MAKKRDAKFPVRPNQNLIDTRLQEQLIDIKSGESGNMSDNKKQAGLLTESIETRLEIIESKSNGKVMARGEFGRVDTPTQNGRIYPRHLMEREINKLSKKFAERKVIGELDHPADGRSSLKNVSHVITSLRVRDDGVVEGEAEILNTRDGQTVRALIEAGIPIGVSSRGQGSVAPSATQEGDEVQEDFQLVTYDFVSTPAVKTALPKFFTEDIEDDKSLAEMFLCEFPDIAEEIRKRGGKLDKNGKIINEKIDIVDSVREQIASDLSEKFERKLKDSLVAVKQDVAEQLREDYDKDPEIGGAKSVLEAIAEMVSVYKPNVDEQAVEDALKAKELEVVEAKSEAEEAKVIARKAINVAHIEKRIAGHPMAESIRMLLKGHDFDSIKEVDEAISAIETDLPDTDSFVTQEEVEYIRENAELKGEITLLENKVEELQGKVVKVVKLSERIDGQRREIEESADEQISAVKARLSSEYGSKIAKLEDDVRLLTEEKMRLGQRLSESDLEVYKLGKVAHFTNGRELLGLLEGVTDRNTVDKLVGKNGAREFRDASLNAMRRQKSSVSKNTSLGDKRDLHESNVSNVYADRDEFGHSMSEMVALAGIKE